VVSHGKTLFEKIWSRHEILKRDDGVSLLYVDRHLIPDGQAAVFGELRKRGLTVRRPDLTVAVVDHYAPSRGRSAGVSDPTSRGMIDLMERGSQETGIDFVGMDDPRHGIAHVIGPELGLTQPGLLMVCGDSHTSTHGALGALAFGIGSSEVLHVLATQTIWQAMPKTMRIAIDGHLAPGVTPKDLILFIIRKIGIAGASGHAIEYAGSTIRNMSVEGRLTVCNMSIEAGAKAGLVAPDDTTFAYLRGRPRVPVGKGWDAALELWARLQSEPEAIFDREISFAAGSIAPMVTWGTSPEAVVSVEESIPDPSREPDSDRRSSMERALNYMGLKPGTPVRDIVVDRVFIGSCANSRIEDLRMAARVVAGKHARIPSLVVPGSAMVRVQAEREGLDRIFIDAGLEWGEPGCSMCNAMNGDVILPGERCASTANRNFVGRQGPGARTHLVSPAMAAAAALTGRFTDVRGMIET
jgi:3-isopropylmalate/(R)-2-methylmalate dehydratase large subunit